MKPTVTGTEKGGLVKNNHIWKNLCIMTVILFLCALVSFVPDNMEIRAENIILIYPIGVLLIIVGTGGFL